MSDLSKKKSQPLVPSQPVDKTFQQYSQIQLVIPRSVFEKAGVELSYQNVMRIVNEVLLPMPRFQGFKCDRRFWHDQRGNGRVILEHGGNLSFANVRNTVGDILSLRLPDDFVLPHFDKLSATPAIKELPGEED